MPWEAYKHIVLTEWKELLAGLDVPESEFQVFFERHPCMLPWIGGLSDIGHHGLFPGAVISQPRLPDFDGAIPDFLLVTRNSMNIYANFVEIETPQKPWFTRNGHPTHLLTQAIDQLRTWSSWFSDPVNTLRFQQTYKLPEKGFRIFKPRFALVYGRRTDSSLTERTIPKRTKMQAIDEEFMTFDRLFPDPGAAQALTVRLKGRKYVAISVPPTVELSPLHAEDWRLIRGKEEAVMRSPYIAIYAKNFWPRGGSIGTNGQITARDPYPRLPTSNNL
jgi:hypothetical protein